MSLKFNLPITTTVTLTDFYDPIEVLASLETTHNTAKPGIYT